jgi:hypothetical protein
MADFDDIDDQYAFPFSEDYGYFQSGMTLRDYFAGQALAGFAAHGGVWVADREVIARQAYKFADAMLKIREVK